MALQLPFPSPLSEHGIQQVIRAWKGARTMRFRVTAICFLAGEMVDGIQLKRTLHEARKSAKRSTRSSTGYCGRIAQTRAFTVKRRSIKRTLARTTQIKTL